MALSEFMSPGMPTTADYDHQLRPPHRGQQGGPKDLAHAININKEVCDFWLLRLRK